MKPILALLAIFTLLSIGACSKEKTTDLPQEMAARKAIVEIKLLVKRGKDELAEKKLVELKERFSHTKTYAEAKKNLLEVELTTKAHEVSFTGKRLIKLENLLLDYRKEAGEWPAPGMIAKPLDAWDNELYWIVAKPGRSYDLLVISSGRDGDPGTGDELITVWAAPKLKKEKPKADHKGKDAGSDSKKKLEKKEAVVMTLDDLLKMGADSGTPADRDATLKQFKTAEQASKKAGQPRDGETIMSLEEIKTKL